jgi:hypothetical protein
MYACTLEADATKELRPLLRVKGTSKVVAAHARVGDGQIIFLPMLLTGSDDDDEEDDYDDDDYDDEDGQHEAAEPPVDDQADEADTEDEQAGDELVDDLVLQWLLSFTSAEEVAWPDWVDGYQFQSEIDRAPAIADRKAEIERIQAELDDLNLEQLADREWKLLIVGSGTPLEEAVASAFTLLGFELEPTTPGRTDLRTTYKGAHAVIEVKGLTKSAAEGNCAQLEKWVAEEKIAGHDAKGILVINAWLNKPLLERTQSAFPDQMRPYAQQRNHCLLTGLQLLNIARTAVAEPDRVEELAALLLNTTGCH